MSFSLVAYESSDEDSENERNESTIHSSKVDDNTIESVISQTCSKLSCIPKTISHSTNDKEEKEEKEEEQEEEEKEEEEEEEKKSSDTEDFKNFLNVLPKPRNFNSTENIEEDDDILLQNETKCPTTTQTKKQTIKITVPSLSEFKDIEEQKEKKLTRVVQPSQKGCGLFAFLVPPKEQKVDNKTLIPQAVKNAAAKINIQQPNVSGGCIKNQRDISRTKKSTVDKSHNELPSDDDEEDAAMDFFGLTADENTLQNYPEVELLDSNRIEESSFTKSMDDTSQNLSFSNRDVSTSDESNNSSSKTLTSNVINLPKEEILLKNKAEVGPKLPVPEQEYNIDTKGNVAFDEKAIEYLCGKRGVKRKDKEIDEANIIEISGEDIKPDEREWLVKALTEEPVQRPVSMQSCGIGSQSKKKHQITYLAHQAKAMELELKNQWSQNRMTRKQTKSKYGF